MTASAVTRTRRRARSPLGRFLYIHGPDVYTWALLALALTLAGVEYATQPHGFARFLVSIVCAL